MSRARSPEEQRAFIIWCESGRTKKPAAIATETGISAAMIRKWKSVNKWDDKPDPKPKGRGAPQGNKNATGNKGGAPEGNENAVKHGFFRKFLPDDSETLEIFDASEDLSPLEILWTSIRIAWTNIVRAQKIQFVRDKDEMIKELKKQKFEIHNTGTKKEPVFEQMIAEQEYEFQFSWDRQATALNSQTAASSKLASMIRQYEAMLRDMPPEKVLEEQRLRVEKLKIEVKKLKEDGENPSDNGNKNQVGSFVEALTGTASEVWDDEEAEK